ncbi:MAG TPA: alkaline phosphatase family protein [Acidimicrobiales bacterium]|nr:alkaline phosphatase family protein [Acidimicrobiales bacterium]
MPKAAPDPVIPAYGGPCVSSLVPALLGSGGPAPQWLPEPARSAGQVVLLVLDGLGWEQLQARRHLAPAMAAMAGGPITTVAPTTTAAALTSISTGMAPSEHGVLGYRVRVGEAEVLNVLRWRTAGGDARDRYPPDKFQTQSGFGGACPPVVTRAEFSSTGFTRAHLSGTRLAGWRVPSGMVVQVAQLLEAGEPFVYAYYDGIDKVAHEKGFGPYYDAEVTAADRLVGDLVAVLPPGAALLVTSDHGQVQVDAEPIPVAPELMADVSLLSGEGRFRWLHTEPGTTARVAAGAQQRYGHLAWVRTREEMVDEGWLGGPLSPEFERRLGDVAIVPFEPVAFLDPHDTGELQLVCRHGSLTPAEALVPLLACGPRKEAGHGWEQPAAR